MTSAPVSFIGTGQTYPPNFRKLPRRCGRILSRLEAAGHRPPRLMASFYGGRRLVIAISATALWPEFIHTGLTGAVLELRDGVSVEPVLFITRPSGPVYMSKKIRKFRTDKFDT